MKSLWVMGALVLATAALPALAGTGAEATATAAPRPVVTEIMTEMPAASRAFAGVIAARTEAQLAFQTLGTMIARDVAVGDLVKSGTIVARLDPEDLQSAVRAAEAAVNAAEVQKNTAAATARRTRALQERNVASTAQLEQADRALASAEAAAQQAKSQLARARDAESFATITAPFDGVVTAVFKEVGTVVSAGDPVLTLASDTAREAVIDLPEPLLEGLEPGTPFAVSPDRDPGQILRARVDRIEPLADAATRTRRVHLALEDGVKLRLGALVRAHRAEGAGAILTLPVAALLDPSPGGPVSASTPPAAAAGGSARQIWVVIRAGDQAHVTARAIVVGPEWMGRVEVLSGLAPGEEVVVRGVHSLAEGQAVGRAVPA